MAVSDDNIDYKYVYLEIPINWTDFIVQFDPELAKPVVGEPYVTDEYKPQLNVDIKKTVAFDTPIITVNSVIIPTQNIVDMEVRYEGFTPSLTFTIKDSKRKLQSNGSPGLQNVVTVIICPDVDGIYRSIKLTFYIKEQENLSDDEIRYTCEYFNLGLTSILCEQIGDEPLKTYDFCYKVAKNLQLGFACTDHCEDIVDKRWRQMYSQSIGQFLQEQIAIGGLDEDSIFDCWIDTHGYLCLINLPWVFSQCPKNINLSIVVHKELNTPTASDTSLETTEIQRTLVYSDRWPYSTMKVVRVYDYVNNDAAKNDMGTDTTFWRLEGAGDTNTLVSEDIQMVENSVAGVNAQEKYKFKKTVFLGCEMAEDLPCVMQKQIRKYWIEKRKAKVICIELMRPNFGLERGTLINLAIMESDPSVMNHIQQNMSGPTGKNTSPDDITGVKINDQSEVPNYENNSHEYTDIINPALSGQYYIDGMIYKYSVDAGRITQVLFLINTRAFGQIVNLYYSPEYVTLQKEAVEKHTVTVN
jgi:hypothetical protein